MAYYDSISIVLIDHLAVFQCCKLICIHVHVLMMNTLEFQMTAATLQGA